MKRFLSVSALALGVSTAANAMTLGAHGVGQVLIYPYYTANGGNGTLLSIVNANEEGKALKVRFHEGLNGRVVADFNLYLSEWDVWVGQVFDTSADGSGPAAIATNDNSCTVPAFIGFGGGFPSSLLFSNAAYSAANADGGPETLARTHEGYFEVIEMGVVTNATKNSLTAITHVAGVPAHCSQVTAAWGAQGYWTQASATDIDPPTGGLYGSEAVLNVAEGTMYTANAEAIDGFSATAQHSAPGSASPDLNTATKSGSGIVSAFLPLGASMVRADYQRSEDAVSALFMAGNLFNEYVVDPAVAAGSDWVVTLPTKRFYTDPALLGANQARAPFNAMFSGAEGGTSCSPISPAIFSREEDGLIGWCGFGVCPPEPEYTLCYGANVLTMGSGESVLATHLAHSGAGGSSVIPVPFRSGQLRIDLNRYANGSDAAYVPLNSANGPALYGLPAFGFLAMRYINGNVTPGVLANYSGDYPHRSRVICTNSTNPQNACQ
ncbi:MAG TPA: hypothetical protein VFI49_10390 [Rudaea sp.]|nr:hypothetical protein [Rudaea sp.]